MPVKRRASKTRHHRITPAAVEAFVAGDYHALHNALNLPIWHPSPLPLAIDDLGVDPDDPPGEALGCAWSEGWPLAVELQRELQAAVGSAT